MRGLLLGGVLLITGCVYPYYDYRPYPYGYGPPPRPYRVPPNWSGYPNPALQYPPVPDGSQQLLQGAPNLTYPQGETSQGVPPPGGYTAAPLAPPTSQGNQPIVLTPPAPTPSTAAPVAPPAPNDQYPAPSPALGLGLPPPSSPGAQYPPGPSPQGEENYPSAPGNQPLVPRVQ